MKILGYWKNKESPAFPDPRDFVVKGWLKSERRELLKYLRSGKMFRGYWGYSHCRFGCGIDDTQMGSIELTDGMWVWPEGLIHYVERHDVILPDVFVEYCRSRNWHIGEVSFPSSDRIDLSFWLSWCKGIDLGK